MSETEPIVPTSSVTALRIPIIKKGEYDLWSMKMRQYIAITDHILWDIITNGNQTTTDPASPSVSAPKTSLAANARRNNEKALNILLSAIPDRHLLSFHDAVDARSLWKAIKARFGGNEASKKMQKNLLKQQFETFTIGSREELDSAYERFQHILSMLELHDATVSIEDANLKFLRSLPSVWHVVATMIRGQPGLDELDFDDLYNNLKVYEHELKGVSNSNSQNIAFLSTEVKGSTLKQSTADPAHIPKGYTQAASSKVQTAPNCASHSDEIICSFFAQQASMPTTHDDEDLLQIDEDAMEEIDIRWQVAMITARIRKFMRKTGRPIDLKPKNGITFDKSKIECFNCQKLGHFARECRFAKYQENRANGRQEKRIVAIEDPNSKALVATDNNEDIDWTKEFDAEPVTFAMMALTELKVDDWSMEFDSEHVHFGQDGLGDFDWSNIADDTPVSLALMATNSEVPYCSKCSKSYKKLLESYQTERDNFQKARSEILGYQMSLESLEVILKTHEKNEYAWGDKYEQMEYDLKMRDLKLEEKQKELDQVLKERDDFKVKLEKWSNASVLQNEVLNKQRYLSDKSCIGFGVESSSSEDSDNSSGNTNSTESLYPNFQKTKGFHAVPPPTGTVIPPRANVSFTGIDELAIRNKVVNQEKTKSSQPEIDRNKVIIEDWVDSDDEETVLNFSEIQKKTVLNSENSETSFENRSPKSQDSVGQGSRKKGVGHKGGKTCFVCYSPDHLIKDCNLHERTFKQTQTHKPKGTQGSRDTRPVWNNIKRVNHSNFSGNSRYPHQKKSFIPSAVLTREGLKSTARPKMTQSVPSKSTVNVFYQGTARPRVPHAVLSQSTGRPYYPRMDTIRPRTSSFSPSTRSSTTRTPYRPQRPKKIMKSIWVKKGSTVGSQAVLPQKIQDNCPDFKEFKVVYVAFGNDSKEEESQAKQTKDESCLMAQRLGHHVRKGKQHRASCKKIEERTVREPLELLHMDLFGPVSVESVNRKKYCLVVTDDCSKFSWVFFLAYKDETYDMLHDLIVGTPQQNGVAERKNRTLIEAARTMLADSLLPIQFWAEAVNTACYVLNRVLVTKPQMKTPYEILMGRSPNISFMRPFGCPLTILNTLDQLGKFDGKSEEGYLLGYSTNSKGFRVYNRVTRKVQDCLHVDFLENQENQKGKGPDWMFDLELLTPSMNYIPVRKENYADSGGNVSTHDDVEDLDDQQFIVHGPNIHAAQNTPSEERTADKEVPLSSEEQALHDELVNLMHQESLAKTHNDAQRIAFEEEKRRIALAKGKECANSTFTLSTAKTPPQSTGNTPTDSDDDVPKDGVFSTNSFDDEHTDNEEDGAPDYNNMDHTIDVSSTPTHRIHKIHPQSQIIGKSTAGVQTRRKLKESTSNQHQALLSFIYKQNRTNHKDQQTCLFACFLSQEEPKKVSQALSDESWVEAMQEELLHIQQQRISRIEAIRLFLAFASFMGFTVYQMDVKSAFLYGNITEEVYVKQPPGFEDPAHPNKVYRVVKALYGLHQAPRAWYERLSTFLLKHGYRRGAIDKTLFIKKDRRDIMLVQVYVDDIIFGSTKSSMVKDFEELMQKEFKMSSMGELTFFLGLQVKQTTAGIFLSQDKYVKDILNKFDFRTIKPASTPIEAHKSLGKDEEGEEVDVHLYRSMIGCLMYLTASRPDIMFAVCLCARFPKGFPHSKEAFSDSDYAGDNHDRRSTSGGCQYLGRRLVSWQCKKQTIVAISSTEAEYVAAASCCAQVLWMQNQLLDYGFNFLNTEIHIDNESTICIVRNPVLHSKTKHIQIRHHFIRDCYEQRLINVVKVHTDDNVADLLTKGFDLARFNFLVVTIGMMNP
ncbi:putative ribonuclease H-like domain-containing protein [Tanacetum coccineum]